MRRAGRRAGGRGAMRRGAIGSGAGAVVAIVAVVAHAAGCGATTAAVDRRGEIDAFNRTLADATRRMDNAALLALWEDDGVSMLPEGEPVVGKAAIGAFVAKIGSQFPAAHMLSFEMTCAGIELAGDTASEYCREHQVVDLAPDKPHFDGTGRMLFVLHRGRDGVWRLRREMWQAAP